MARRQQVPAPPAPPGPTQDPQQGSPARASTTGLDPDEVRQIAALPFDEAIEELEEILEHIERGTIGLEEALRQFRRGDALVKRCRAILDAAELQVRELSPREERGREDSSRGIEDAAARREATDESRP